MENSKKMTEKECMAHSCHDEYMHLVRERERTISEMFSKAPTPRQFAACRTFVRFMEIVSDGSCISSVLEHNRNGTGSFVITWSGPGEKQMNFESFHYKEEITDENENIIVPEKGEPVHFISWSREKYGEYKIERAFSTGIVKNRCLIVEYGPYLKTVADWCSISNPEIHSKGWNQVNQLWEKI